MSSKEISGEEVVGAIIGIGAGILLGLLGAAIIEAMTKPECPVCGTQIPRKSNPCPVCHAPLKWG